MTEHQHQPDETVDEWNRLFPVGTPITYWGGLREGDGERSRTRSRASMLGGHTPVVWVEGRPDCIALTHVEWRCDCPGCENGERCYMDTSMTLDEAVNTPSESGYGWMLDGLTPFYPGTQCIHCGRFVGREDHIGIERAEMSSRIVSIEGEHHECARAAEARWEARRAG